MNKLFVLIGIFILLFVVPSFAQTPTPITNCSELQAVITGDYILTKDIDCQGVQFVPLKNNAGPGFRGVFDGQNFAIKNLSIVSSEYIDLALFARLEKATVKNLRIENFRIENTSSAFVGATAAVLAAEAQGASIIDHVIVKNGVVLAEKSEQSNVSGLVNFGAKATIKNSAVENVQLSGFLTSPFIGTTFLGLTMDQNYFKGTTRGFLTEGFAGYVYLFPGNSLKITNSYFNADVQSTDYMCGVGNVNASVDDNKPNIEVRNVYFAGKMTPVPANQFLFCSDTDPYANLFKNTNIVTEGVYFNNDDMPNFLVNEFNGVALTTAQMKQKAKFPTLDFANVWEIDEGNDYPQLQWKTTKISDCQQLQDMNKNLSGNYALANDIECKNFGGEQGFVPIGPIFKGSLDGKNFKIKNLYVYVRHPSKESAGLFAQTESATIKNLTLTNANIMGSPLGVVGGVVGKSINTNIFNIHLIGKVEINYLGGETLTFGPAGGLVGMMSKGTIEQSSVEGTVYSRQGAGGLVSLFLGGNIIRSFSNGSVSACYVMGGLVGHSVDQDAPAVISDSYSLSTIKPQCDLVGTQIAGVGGLIGYADYSSPSPQTILIRSFAANTIEIGKYNIANNQKGGLYGSAPNYRPAKFSYWDKDKNTAVTPDSEARTTVQMKTLSNYPPKNDTVSYGWDFVDVWRIQEGKDYPRLKWEKSVDIAVTEFFVGQQVDVNNFKAQEGEKLFFTSTFQNIGLDPAGKTSIAYYVGFVGDDPSKAFQISKDVVAEGMLPAGGMQTFVSSNSWTAAAGTYTVSTVVDLDNEVVETNKTNNTVSGTLTVVAQPAYNFTQCRVSNCGGFSQNQATYAMDSGNAKIVDGKVKIVINALTLNNKAASKTLEVHLGVFGNKTFSGARLGTITTDAQGNFNDYVLGSNNQPYILTSKAPQARFILNDPGKRSEFITNP